MKTTPIFSRTSFGVQQTFASLQSPNYRLWFLGQLMSLVGTWMQTTAQGYLVYSLTKSPAFLGYVGFAGGVPSWVFTLYGGVVADRVARRTLLILTQSAMMVLAFVLAALVAANLVQPWQIVVLALLLGIANAFDAPARQAFVVELVDRKDLTNAIALNSTMFNMATVVGPAVAGAVYAAFGPTWCFVINGLSYIAVIVALALMKIKAAPPAKARRPALEEVRQGVSYTASHSMIRTLIVNMGFLSVFGFSMMTLLPAWSVDVLGGDVKTNGLLLSARGLGALAGALLIAALGGRPVRGKLWTVGSFLMPAALLAFAAARWLPSSLVLIMITGWAFMVVANTSNALIQTNVPDELRGRVMSLYTLTFFGAMPVGSLLIGTVADRIGEPMTLVLNAGVLLVAAAFVWVRLPFIRKLG